GSVQGTPETTLKSLSWGPTIVAWLTCSTVPGAPTFCNVTALGPKTVWPTILRSSSCAGVAEIAGAAPAPDSVISAGAFGSLLAMRRTAPLVPTVDGRKRISRLQSRGDNPELAAAKTRPTHSLRVTSKSTSFERTAPVRVRGATPPLETVSMRGGIQTPG